MISLNLKPSTLNSLPSAFRIIFESIIYFKNNFSKIAEVFLIYAVINAFLLFLIHQNYASSISSACFVSFLLNQIIFFTSLSRVVSGKNSPIDSYLYSINHLAPILITLFIVMLALSFGLIIFILPAISLYILYYFTYLVTTNEEK